MVYLFKDVAARGTSYHSYPGGENKVDCDGTCRGSIIIPSRIIPRIILQSVFP